ncbi:MAG: UDP-2,3-diacylglucosamine diphosphatase, partial [bacterium]
MYSNHQLDEAAVDFFIFGHRHLPIDHTLKNGTSRYINLGEWMHYNSYAVFDGTQLRLEFFENPDGKIYG